MKTQLTIRDSFDVLLRRRLPLLLTSATVFLIAAAIAVLLPSVYVARSTILIERQEIPQDLVRSVITSFADQRIYQISQRVMTNRNLNSIIEKYNLYEDDLKKDPLEVVLEAMREDIALEPVSADVVDPRSGRPSEATIAFTLSYESKSPALAQQVANELVSLFLQENLKERAETAEETSGFLADEAEKLSENIAALETQLATFKQNNIESLPELTQLNWRLLDQIDAELRDVERQIRASEETLVFINAELSKTPRTMNLISETGERILSASDRLKVLENEYVSLTARYGIEHPDVVRVSNELNALRAQVGEEGDLEEAAMHLGVLKNKQALMLQRYSNEHPEVKKIAKTIAAIEQRLENAPTSATEVVNRYKVPNNPAYVQLNARREAAESSLRSMKAKKGELVAKRESIESKLMSMPEVERAYSSLRRGYENAVAKYQEVVSKKLEAEVSQSLETEQKGERLTLIEPPSLPERPAKPNRLGILFVGAVFAFLGGIGAAATSEALDSTIRGRRGVIDALEVPPLATIPDLDTGDRRRGLVFWTVLILVVLVTSGAALYVSSLVLDRPVDVLWYQLLRKLGLS